MKVWELVRVYEFSDLVDRVNELLDSADGLMDKKERQMAESIKTMCAAQIDRISIKGLTLKGESV